MRAVKLQYDALPWKQFRDNTGLHYKPVKVGNLGFSKFTWAAGVSEKWHSHIEEPQILLCLSGRVEFGVRDEAGERVEILGPGDVMLIQPGVEHRAQVSEPTEILVMFSPMNRFDADAIIV